ncbi:hypothetical protein [Paenibacillus humicola]|uniref:hypothetical protein n=1 Tax=Paenibacillus humicola TaxID=3110540 RepID=UPI00237ABCBA|nr:hypothetical protein [Paenibacillus humicola]
MSKQNDILNRMKSGRKNGAQTFLDNMQEQFQKHELEPIHETSPINEIIHVTEPETGHIQKTNHAPETEPTHINETKTETEHIHEHETVQKTINEYESILEKFSVKKTKEEMFTRQTYLIRNDLIKRFDLAAKNRKKGFKTEVINELLENFLRENGL